jgi:hypothetical protein
MSYPLANLTRMCRFLRNSRDKALHLLLPRYDAASYSLLRLATDKPLNWCISVPTVIIRQSVCLETQWDPLFSLVSSPFSFICVQVK